MKLYSAHYADGELATFPVCEDCMNDGVDDCPIFREIVCTVHNRDETCSECERLVLDVPDGGPRGDIFDGFGNTFDYAIPGEVVDNRQNP